MNKIIKSKVRNIIRERLNFIFLILMFVLLCGAWIPQVSYRIPDSLVTLGFSFISLVFIVININYIPVSLELVHIILILSLAAFSMIFSSSNIGSLFMLFNLISVLFISKFVKINEKQFHFVSFLYLCFFIIWIIAWPTIFNPNNLGVLTLITFMTSAKLLLSKRIIFIYWILYGVAFFFILKSKSRAALLGILVFLLINHVVSKKIWTQKFVYSILCMTVTWGSLFIVLFYLYLSKINVNFLIPIINKPLFTGRENIWMELLTEFIKRPLSGIGSAYHLKSHGNFNAHNTVLNLLVVFGVPVFLLVMILLYNQLKNIRIQIINDDNQIIFSFSAIISFLVVSYFETTFIYSPFMPVLFFWFVDLNNYNINCKYIE